MPERDVPERYYILGLVKQLFGTLKDFIPLNVILVLLGCTRAKGENLSEGEEPRRTRQINECTDKWVLGNMTLSIVCFLGFCGLHCMFRFIPIPRALASGIVLLLAAPVGFYAVWRIYGIVVSQFSVLALDPVRKLEEGDKYGVESHERSFVLALMNYITILFWFAFAYRNAHFLFSRGGQPDGLFRSLYASLATMSLLGAGKLEPKGPLGYILLLTQLAVALFMTSVVLAQAVGTIQRKTLAELDAESRKQVNGIEPGSDPPE